jgi:hypothetical protein
MALLLVSDAIAFYLRTGFFKFRTSPYLPVVVSEKE